MARRFKQSGAKILEVTLRMDRPLCACGDGLGFIVEICHDHSYNDRGERVHEPGDVVVRCPKCRAETFANLKAIPIYNYNGTKREALEREQLDLHERLVQIDAELEKLNS